MRHRITNLFVFCMTILSFTMCTTKTVTYRDDVVEIDIQSLMSLPIEEFDYLSNSAIAEVEYFQPHDTIMVPFGLYLLGNSWLAIYYDGVMVIDKISGKVASNFNHTGGGPEEYVKMLGLAVDHEKETCHVLTVDNPTKIKTYSYEGQFLGELQLSSKIHPAAPTFSLYDDSYFFVEVNSLRRMMLDDMSDPFSDKPYLLINRTTGEVQQLPIERTNAKICNRYIPKDPSSGAPNWSLMIHNVAGGENRKIISEFSHDTIFTVENKKIVPIAVKKNWNKDPDSADLVSVLYANNHYIIFEVVHKLTDHNTEALSYDESKSGTFIYDMQGKEFHRYKTELFLESNGFLYSSCHIDKLIEAAADGEIKDPKLLDIIANSNDESNWVWYIYHISE